MALNPDTDAIILRQLYVERFGNGFASDIYKPLRSLDQDINTLIRNFFYDARGRDIKDLIRRNRRNYKVRYLIDELESIVAMQMRGSVSHADKQMDLLAASMVDHTYGAFGSKAVDRPASSQIVNLPVIGLAVGAAWENLHKAHLEKIIQSMIKSVGLDVDPVLAVRGTRRQGYKDGITHKRNTGINALAITQSYGIASNARSAAYARLGVRYEVLAATLDFRTTPYCRAVDGDIHVMGEGPLPPFHYRCRTLRVPYTSEQEERPFVKDGRPVSRIPVSDRDGKIGQTNDTYQQFFERLNPNQQEEVIGAERYKRYKSGKFDSLKDLIDFRTGRTYTIKELDALY